MNCEKLNQDIAKLQVLRDKFAQKIDELNDTMRRKIEVRKMQEEVRGLEDQILESYLVEFKEKNPELFRWRLEKRIDGFKSGGRLRNIESIASLPDGEGVLVGGDGGALFVCRKDEDEKWKLEEKIDGFEDANGNYCYIESIAPLPDGEGMLVGGTSGVLYACRKGEDGKWKLEEKVGSKDIRVKRIESVAQLPNGEGMLVGGDYGTLCVCRKDKDGKWKLEDKIEGFDFPVDINCIAQLPDGEGMLVGDSGGALYVCRKGEDGRWELGEEIGEFKSLLFLPNSTTTIAPLPDGEGMLVGGNVGTLYVCRKGEDGKWKLEDKIDGFVDTRGLSCNIHSIASLPDGEGMLVGGDYGALYEVCPSDLSVDTIRQNLDIIIQKGAV